MLAIKNMKMPSCCLWDCPLAREDGGACQLADVRTSDKERPKDCPLVEIVTCKDCKHCKKDVTEGEKLLWCKKDGFATSEGYYCGSGKRE